VGERLVPGKEPGGLRGRKQLKGTSSKVWEPYVKGLEGGGNWVEDHLPFLDCVEKMVSGRRG